MTSLSIADKDRFPPIYQFRYAVQSQRPAIKNDDTVTPNWLPQNVIGIAETKARTSFTFTISAENEEALSISLHYAAPGVSLSTIYITPFHPAMHTTANLKWRWRDEHDKRYFRCRDVKTIRRTRCRLES